MNFNRHCQNTFLFLIIVTFSTQTFGMDWLLGCFKRMKPGYTLAETINTSSEMKELDESGKANLEKTKIPFHPDFQFDHHAQLFKLLYEILDTLPPELIRIIIDYSIRLLQGTCTTSIDKAPNLNCIVPLHDNIYVTGAEGLHVWDNAGNLITQVDLQSPAQGLLALTNKQLVAAEESGIQFLTINEYGITNGKRLKLGNYDFKALLQLSPETLAVITTSLIKLINLISKELDITMEATPYQTITKAIQLFDKNLLIACDNMIIWWDALNHEKIPTKSLAHTKQINDLAQLSDGFILFSDSQNIFMLDTFCKGIIRRIGNNEHGVLFHITPLPDALLAVASLCENNIHIWDPHQQKRLKTIENAHQKGIKSLLPFKDNSCASIGYSETEQMECKVWY